jgi:hypothetical protein
MPLRLAGVYPLANNSVREANLICHPATPPFMADHIDVSIEASDDGRLKLRYELHGDTETLMLPLIDEPARRDRLWQTTCFELFVRRVEGDSYLEYNFSPSTEWALYRFGAYRDGMAEEMVDRPIITCDFSERHFGLNADIVLPDKWQGKSLFLGLSAVIEESDGTKSYWALTHPPGKPDFHHKDCFALQLEAPSAA